MFVVFVLDSESIKVDPNALKKISLPRTLVQIHLNISVVSVCVF